MTNFFTFGSVSSFFACLLLGAAYAWVLYGTNRNLARRLKIWLAVCRTLVVGLIAWLLFAPLVKVISYTPEKPIIVLAQDNSLSIANVQTADFNQQRYQKDLQALSDRLSKKYEVKIYNFGDSVKAGFDFSHSGKLSNASALVAQLNDELMNRNVGAVILASDGIFNRGGNPLYEIDKIKAPFFTIALGDTIPKKDVLIANITYNNLVYLDNEFVLDVEVQAFDGKDEVTQLSVYENGKKIKEQSVQVNSNSFTQDISLKIKANQIGIQQYTVTLSGIKNEVTTKNNSQTIFIEVIDARQKVLLAAAAPHPDLALFKQSIERNQHYEVTLALADELDNLDITKFSLGILYQLPNQFQIAAPSLARLQAAKLPLWYIIGAQTNISAFNQMQRKLNLGRATGATQEIFPHLSSDFAGFDLNPEWLKQLGTYDPLQAPFVNLNVNGSYTALLYQRIGKINTQNPLLFFMDDDNRKIGVLLGEGLWKWKLDEAKDEKSFPLTDEIISKTVQFLSVKDDRRRFKVYSSKPTFEENENVVLNATLYNESYEAVNSPEVAVQVKNEAGKVFNYTFSKFANGYRLDAGLLPQGKYSYVAQTSLGGKTFSATGAFFVNAIVAEYQQTTANHRLLYTMANQSNGKMFAPANLLAIEAELEQSGEVKTITYEDRKYDELINIKWLFILVILWLSAEWFLRKRNGEA